MIDLNVPKESIEKLQDELKLALEHCHGICSCCIHNSPYHRQGKCENCDYDNANYDRQSVTSDNWEWVGLKV